MKSRICDICNIDVHRQTFAKHLGGENHSEIEKQNELNITEWLFKKPIESKTKKDIILKNEHK